MININNLLKATRLVGSKACLLKLAKLGIFTYHFTSLLMDNLTS